MSDSDWADEAPGCFQALNAVAEIYGRPRLSAAAVTSYCRLSHAPDECSFIERLAELTASRETFPLPCHFGFAKQGA